MELSVNAASATFNRNSFSVSFVVSDARLTFSAVPNGQRALFGGNSLCGKLRHPRERLSAPQTHNCPATVTAVGGRAPWISQFRWVRFRLIAPQIEDLLAHPTDGRGLSRGWAKYGLQSSVWTDNSMKRSPLRTKLPTVVFYWISETVEVLTPSVSPDEGKWRFLHQVELKYASLNTVLAWVSPKCSTQRGALARLCFVLRRTFAKFVAKTNFANFVFIAQVGSSLQPLLIFAKIGVTALPTLYIRPLQTIALRMQCKAAILYNSKALR
jgi:hypothetical protein